MAALKKGRRKGLRLAIISDIKMPGMDGLTLLQRLREVVPDVPALLITGHGELDLAIQALRTGAFDLVQKPLDRDHLVAALNRAIETRRLRRELKDSQEALRKHAAELEQRVEERTAELKHALRAKDEFLHWLRMSCATRVGDLREDRIAETCTASALPKTTRRPPWRT